MLGKMGHIRKLSLLKLPIKELPVSFQNLTGLHQLYVDCDFVQLSSIVLTPELSELIVYNCKEWKCVKSKEGEEEVGSTVSSNVESFWSYSYNLDDDFFSKGFTQLAQVRQMWLEKSNFTFLPECLREFHNMYALDVSDCKLLEEIRGIPPNLKHFRAINCVSLTSSGSSMLLNQQLHEAGGTVFVFPGGSIPAWLDKQSKGPSISFWFRNKFPAKVLCLLIAPVLDDVTSGLVRPMVLINGKVQEYRFHRKKGGVKMVELDHIHLFDLRQLHFHDDLMECS